MSDDETTAAAAEQRGDALAPEARDLEAELRERVDTPDGDDLSEVDGDTAAAFWAAVFYVNVGVLLIAVGPMLYVLRGGVLLAAALVLGGAALLLRAYFVYRKFDADRDADDTDTARDAADDTDAAESED